MAAAGRASGPALAAPGMITNVYSNLHLYAHKYAAECSQMSDARYRPVTVEWSVNYEFFYSSLTIKTISIDHICLYAVITNYIITLADRSSKAD